jgi:hypothetical protein
MQPNAFSGVRVLDGGKQLEPAYCQVASGYEKELEYLSKYGLNKIGSIVTGVRMFLFIPTSSSEVRSALRGTFSWGKSLELEVNDSLPYALVRSTCRFCSSTCHHGVVLQGRNKYRDFKFGLTEHRGHLLMLFTPPASSALNRKFVTYRRFNICSQDLCRPTGRMKTKQNNTMNNVH